MKMAAAYEKTYCESPEDGLTSSDYLNDNGSHLEGLMGSNLIQILPFHVMVNREMTIVQCGAAVAKFIHWSNCGQPLDQLRLTDIFRVLEPDHYEALTFDDIIALDKSIFALELRPEFSMSKFMRSAGRNDLEPMMDCSSNRLILKGRAIHVEEASRLLFQLSPSISNLDELEWFGLDLNDIPGHDVTRDIIIWRELLRQERQEITALNHQVEELRKELDDLEKEKALSDRLLYSILPPPVADQLRTGASVAAARYDSVSILFSGICEFGGFCLSCQPIDVVSLLNDLYSQFDNLAEEKSRKVYKVETVGDKYMLVSGLPKRNAGHAECIAKTALDMLDIGRRTSVNGHKIRLTMGVHTGEAVAGVVGQRMPHYAVFGGAVCQASRMESNGLPDSVNISEATYRILRRSKSSQQMLFKERGPMTMKGFNEPIKCYLLYRHPDYASDAYPRIPHNNNT